MNKVEGETAVHEGQVWQIGEMYQFSDDGANWVGVPLKGFAGKVAAPCQDSNSHRWKHIRPIDPADLGTVTPVPVELVDGSVYVFSVGASVIKGIGFYDEYVHAFYSGPMTIAHVTSCTNIRLLEEAK